MLARTLMVLLGALFLYFQNKRLGNAFALLPLFVGSGCGGCGDCGDCGGGPGSCGNEQCKSLIFSYRNSDGQFNQVSIHEPRDWRHGTEAIEFPREAISTDGTMAVRIDFTKRHKLSFAGVLQEPEEMAYRNETLLARRAIHSRTGEIAGMLDQKRNVEYGHMIPGDTIDVEFDDPKIEIKGGEKETYVMQSSGFYTTLRRRSKEIAGNWFDGISAEARSHYKELTDLRSYR